VREARGEELEQLPVPLTPEEVQRYIETPEESPISDEDLDGIIGDEDELADAVIRKHVPWYAADEDAPAAIGPIPVDLWRLPVADLKSVIGASGRVVVDNPGGEWLEDERQGVMDGRASGALTARIDRVEVPVDDLLALEGRRGEHERLTMEDERVLELAKAIEKDGLTSPPFLNVEYDGSVNVNEGNHRIRAAKLAGLERIPVEIAYYAGGERMEGPMSLRRLAELNRPEDIPAQVDAWHGSGTLFDRFSADYIGTGEARMSLDQALRNTRGGAFGWGMYVSESRGVGRWYAEQQGQESVVTIDGQAYGPADFLPGPLMTGLGWNEVASTAEEIAEGNTEGALDAIDDWLDAFGGGVASRAYLARMSSEEARGIAEEMIDADGELTDGTWDEQWDRLSELEPDVDHNAIHDIREQANGDGAVAFEYLRDLVAAGRITVQPGRHLYQVTAFKDKDPSEYDFLEWDEPFTQEQFDKVISQLRAEADEIIPDTIKDKQDYITNLIESLRWSDMTGGGLYKELARQHLDSDKATSLFLLRAGIDGIKRPTGAISGVPRGVLVNGAVWMAPTFAKDVLAASKGDIDAAVAAAEGELDRAADVPSALHFSPGWEAEVQRSLEALRNLQEAKDRITIEVRPERFNYVIFDANELTIEDHTAFEVGRRPQKTNQAAAPFTRANIKHVGLKEAVEAGLVTEDEAAVIDGVQELFPEAWREHFEPRFSPQQFTPSTAQLKAHGIAPSRASEMAVQGVLLTDKVGELKTDARHVAVMFAGNNVDTFLHEFGEFAFKRLLGPVQGKDYKTVTREYRKAEKRFKNRTYRGKKVNQGKAYMAKNEWFADGFRDWWIRNLNGQEGRSVVSKELQGVFRRVLAAIKQVWQRLKAAGKRHPLDDLFNDIITNGRELSEKYYYSAKEMALRYVVGDQATPKEMQTQGFFLNGKTFWSWDPGSICPKKRNLLEYVAKHLTDGKLGDIRDIDAHDAIWEELLNPDFWIRMYEQARNEGVDVPCSYCYVEQARNIARDAWLRGKSIEDVIAAKAKPVYETTPYVDKILKWQQKRIDEINARGGLRLFSFSDYVRDWHHDQVKRLLEHAKKRGLSVKAITKTSELVEDFGDTGIVINLSIDDGVLGQNGGMAWDEALRLKKKYPDSVRVRTVALNLDDYIEAVTRNWKGMERFVDVITPYHHEDYTKPLPAGATDFAFRMDEHGNIVGKDSDSQELVDWIEAHPEYAPEERTCCLVGGKCFRPEHQKQCASNCGAHAGQLRIPEVQIGEDLVGSVGRGGTLGWRGGVESPAFKRWFGDSKVVDAAGRPRVVYHGTTEDFGTFDFAQRSRFQKDSGWLGEGFYFTSSPDLASSYTHLKAGSVGSGRNVMPVYLSLQNPYYATMEDKQRLRGADFAGEGRAEAEAFREELIAKGHDGVILDFERADGLTELVAFQSNQIKSATGNAGTYSLEDDDIAASIGPKTQIRKATGQVKDQDLRDLQADLQSQERAARQAFRAGKKAGVAEHLADQAADQRGVKQRVREATGVALSREDQIERDNLRNALKMAARNARIAHSEGRKEGVEEGKAKIRALVARAQAAQRLKNEAKGVRARVKKALEKTKVKRKDGKPMGRFGAERQRVLDGLREIDKLTREEAANRLEGNLAAMATTLPTYEQALENRMLDMKMTGLYDVTEQSIQNWRVLLADIEMYKAEGQTERSLSEANRQAYNEMYREAILEIVGGLSEEAEVTGRRKKETDLSLKERLRNAAFAGGFQAGAIQDWDNLLDILSFADRQSAPGRSIISEAGNVFDAELAEKHGVVEALEQIREMYREAYGAETEAQELKQIEEDSVELDLGTFENADGIPVELKMSKSEARKRWMELLDPTLHEVFFARRAENGTMGWTDEMAEAIDAVLTEDDKAFAQAQLDWYQQYYDRINEVYSDLYGVNLPHNDVYTPISREGVAKDEDTFSEFLKDAPFRGSAATAGSLKSRVRNMNSITQQSDTAVLQRHIMEMEHFKAWARRVRDLNAVFGAEEVRRAIRENYGHNMVKELDSHIQDFARGKMDESQNFNLLDKWRVNYTKSVLAVKVSLFVKQLTSVFAFADTIPVTAWGSGFAEGLAQGDKTIRQLFKASTFLQERWTMGSIERDIKAARQTDEYHKMVLKPSFRNRLMFLVRAGDMAAIIYGGYPVYKYHLEQLKKQGAKDPEKKAIAIFEAQAQETQQSSDLSKMSRFQKGSSLYKLFTMFKTTPLQYLRKEISALRNLAASRIGVKQFAKTLMIYHFVLPMVFQWVSDLFPWGDEDEEGVAGLPIRRSIARAAILGNLNGAFIFGDMLAWLIDQTLGLYNPDIVDLPPKQIADDLVKGIREIDPDDLTSEDVFGAVRALAGAAGGAAGLPAKQAVDFSKGFSDLLSGEYEKGIAELAGWSPYTAEKRFEE